MILSPHFELSEFTFSESAVRNGILNIPTNEELENLKLLCERILEPIRNQFGIVIVTSGYRNKEVNKLIGSSDKSQHIQGKAADIIVKKYSVEVVFDWITTKSKLPFDQCIQEYNSWVHVSYDKDRQRKQALRIG